jgi:predicted nuclease with TOPRIM domain
MRKKKLLPKEEKDGNIGKLKNRIARLQKENDRLKSEIKTLESYKNLTTRYVKNELDGVPVEKVISGIKKQKDLKEIKDSMTCIKCGTDYATCPSPKGVIYMCKNTYCGHREIVNE